MYNDSVCGNPTERATMKHYYSPPRNNNNTNKNQVGLPLLSLDGMAVRRVKQWILRCAACFKTCTEMGKHFCPVCGNATLDRVSCTVNAKTGATYVHLRKNHKVNLRGSKFSIPAPDPTKGRFEGDLLLREDQLLTGIWAQKVRWECVGWRGGSVRMRRSTRTVPYWRV